MSLAPVLLAASLVVPLVAVPIDPPEADTYRPGTTATVAAAHDGGPPTSGASGPRLTPDGRVVAFSSRATDLVAGGGNGELGVYVRDRVEGTTERVSVSTAGAEADAMSYGPAITPDGRYVAFSSQARNLVDDDTNGQTDVFVRDRVTGVTERVSLGVDSEQLVGGSSSGAATSADGRFVAFSSGATNLSPAGTTQVYVRDRHQATTELVSMAHEGGPSTGETSVAGISDDGRRVLFLGTADDLVPGDSNLAWDIFLHDRSAGTTQRVSVGVDGVEPNGNSYYASMTPDATVVQFTSVASNLVPEQRNLYRPDVFARDLPAGTTERVSVTSAGAELAGYSYEGAISPDGRFVAFVHWPITPLPGVDTGGRQLVLHDRYAGATELVSIGADGERGNAVSSAPSVSAGGNLVAFDSWATNLVPGGPSPDAFVRDRGTDLGIGRFTATRVDDGLAVEGWATFSQLTTSGTVNSIDDPLPGARQLGGELVAGSLTHRPERGDLLVRLRLAELPSVRPPGTAQGPLCLAVYTCPPSGPAGAPAVVYALAFEAGGIAYEARAQRVSATAAGQAFALYRCDGGCEEVARLDGGVGTVGNEVRLAIPLSALALGDDRSVTSMRAFTALGDTAAGGLVVLHEASLNDITAHPPQFTVGLAGAGEGPDRVVFDHDVDLTQGRFSTILPAPADGDVDVWGRVCLGADCHTHRADVHPDPA